MLSQNDWRNDSRLLREAEALARLGHEVHVVSRSTPGADRATEARNGVVHHTVPRTLHETPRSIMRLVGYHASVLALHLRSLPRGPKRLESLRSGLQLVGVAAAASAAAPIIALPRLRRSRPVRRLSRRLSEQFAGHVEALRYLNDFGATCGALVRRLGPDVVHAHDLITLSGGAIAAARTGARLVYDAHELETHTNYDSLSPQTKRWIARYERALIGQGSVVTVCDSIADWLRDEYEVDRPVVVMNAPIRHPAAKRTRTLRAALDLDRATPLVVYVGSVTVDRGLELTVEALREVPDVHLATVGWRYAETERRMREVAEHAGVMNRLHFVDAVPSEAVVSFIADANASVIPIQDVCLSYAFCFPNKLLESVFAGLPVAVSNLVELRRFVDETGLGLVMDETDPADIARTLRRLLAQHDRFAPSQAAIATVEGRYGWSVQEERLRALYDRLAPRPQLSTPHTHAVAVRR